MRKQNLILGCSVVGMAFLSGVSACTSSSGQTGAKDAGRPDSTASGGAGGARSGTGGASRNDAGCIVGDPNSTYVLIDDMEKTTHGPIEFDATGEVKQPAIFIFQVKDGKFELVK